MRVTAAKRVPIARARFDRLPTDYRSLVALLPPRTPRSDAEAGRATRMIAALAGFDLTADQTDYLALLARLNDEWRRSRPGFSRAKPFELVRLMMDEHGLTLAQMGQVMGVPKSGVSMILSGTRELSKASIRRLADRFALDPASLL